jgi:ADP-heptose:LPS heptosyltransferase
MTVLPGLVSCIMPTANRRSIVPHAVNNFLSQDYPDCELVIVDDGDDAVGDLIPDNPRVRYVRLDAGLTLGAKRNRACELSRGSIILHWDDDDWYPPNRISRQVEALSSGAQICGSSRIYFREVAHRRAWEYSYTFGGKPWVAGSTLAYQRAAWERLRFRELQVGEDCHFVWAHERNQVCDLADSALCVAAIHPLNTSPKKPVGSLWRPIDPALVDRVIEEAERQSRAVPSAASVIRAESTSNPGLTDRDEERPSALVGVASGIGDVIRATPMISVLHELGYHVDVLCGADYPQTAELLRGAPQVREIIVCSGVSPEGRAAALSRLSSTIYEVAWLAHWAGPLAANVNARKKLRVDATSWLAAGDTQSVAAAARELGWVAPLPPPFVVTSSRQFDLKPGTIALHPGCKKGWPWKKWHGFAELAEHLEDVVIVGTDEDIDVAGTYFGRRFKWPAHAVDFTGKLSLSETAALVAQCEALVCNDSGMQHIGAAVGTTTYPIYGITSPEREAIPVSHVRPVTKGLSCEADCHRQPWGRRDCHLHLECLKTMTADEIVERMKRDGIATRYRKPGGSGAHYAPPQIPAETITIAARLDGGIGDVMLASPLLEALFDTIERCEIDVFFHQPEAARFIFANARFVRRVHPVSQLAQIEGQYDVSLRTLQFARYAVRAPEKIQRVCPDFAERMREAGSRFNAVRGLADRQPSLDGLWGRISVRAGRNVLDSIGYLGGLDVNRHTDLFLAPDPAAYAFLSSQIGGCGERYITVHDGFDNSVAIPPGAATKCWPIEHWQALVGALKSSHPNLRIVQIGARKSRHISGVDIDLVERTTLHETAWILKNAQFHIDTDSGLVHIARALHTPAIVLFGPTDVGYYAHDGNINLAPAECGNCWWSTPDWLSRCPRGLAAPVCMSSVSPATVVEHAHRILQDEYRLTASAGPVTLYDGTLIQEDSAVLDNLCEVLDLERAPITSHIRNERTGVCIHASKQWEYLYALRALADADSREENRLKIADLGGGRGALAPYLAHRGHDVEVFDVDYLWDHGGDPSIETKYRRWARDVGYRARFGSLYNVPAKSSAFDVVTCISVVEHVPHKEYVLKEAFRILKPGGILILTFDFATAPSRFEDGMRREIFSPERVADSLNRLGISFTPVDARMVEESAIRIQSDGVCGIPEGMTVAGMVIKKGSAPGSGR